LSLITRLTAIPLKKQTGKYGCVDNALDNISASDGLGVSGSDVRTEIAPNSSPYELMELYYDKASN
jgi:hypothetical protein